MPAKVLVVDDEPDMPLLVRQRFRHAIRAGELEFTFAQNGREALEALQRDPGIEVVLTDIKMPEMDGLTFLSELERLGCPARTVVISAYGDLANIRTAMNRGAFDFLTKPLDFQDVEVTIRKTLDFVERLKESRRAEEYRIAKEVAEENYQQLQELERLRHNLTHMIVHDMRTPLTAMLIGLQSARRKGEANEGQGEFLDLANQGAQMLLGMINDLLDISKMEDGSMQLSFADVQVEALVEQALGQVGSLARDKRVELVRCVAPELPTVPADEEKLRRILVNLVGNSIHFTPPGGAITVAAHAFDGGVEFSVADTGPGIPAEALERIFEKFGQVEDRQSQRVMSTGLGLTFCKMAVEAHRGRIWVESELGQGSKFRFIIPWGAQSA